MDSVRDTACAVGCPIRRSRDQRSLASPPGFSQRATSFIASQCQGIHQMPLPIRLIAKPVACRDKPRNPTSSHEDTLPEASSQLAAISYQLQSKASVSLPLHTLKDQTPAGPPPRPAMPTGNANFSRSSAPWNRAAALLRDLALPRRLAPLPRATRTALPFGPWWR